MIREHCGVCRKDAKMGNSVKQSAILRLRKPQTELNGRHHPRHVQTVAFRQDSLAPVPSDG